MSSSSSLNSLIFQEFQRPAVTASSTDRFQGAPYPGADSHSWRNMGIFQQVKASADTDVGTLISLAAQGERVTGEHVEAISEELPGQPERGQSVWTQRDVGVGVL